MIEAKDIFNKEYAYAKANGYDGSHSDYVKVQYNGYVATCVRMHVTPMNWYYWLQSQRKG